MKRMTSDLTNVESLTINHLAEEAGTSLASVQRFCQKMGYSGFKEFKFQLLTYIKKQESQEAAVSSSEYLMTTMTLSTGSGQQMKRTRKNWRKSWRPARPIFIFDLLF